MNASLLVRSKFMVSREFGTLDIPKEPMVTIVGVKKPDEKDSATQDWWLLSFAEPWAKPLKIITTHQQALILMFGDETDAWKGKRIALRAVVGTYFNRRQTAVRIYGSPDIKEPCSFSVRKFGGGSDNYNLSVLQDGRNQAAAAPKVIDTTNLVAAFAGLGVAQEALSARIGKPLAQATEADVATLRADFKAKKALATVTPEQEAKRIEAEKAEAGIAAEQAKARAAIDALAPPPATTTTGKNPRFVAFEKFVDRIRAATTEASVTLILAETASEKLLTEGDIKALKRTATDRILILADRSAPKKPAHDDIPL